MSPGGRIVAFRGASGSVLLWDAEDRRAFTTIRKDAALIARLQFSADGRMLAVATENSWTRLWDVALTNLVAEFVPHAPNRTDWVDTAAMCFSRDGELHA